MWVGRDISVGVAARYGLDGPHPSRLALGPNRPPTQWLPVLSRRYSSRAVEFTTDPQSNAEVKEREELYIYSPSGSSWPVLR